MILRGIMRDDRAWCRVLEFAQEFGITASFQPFALGERRGVKDSPNTYATGWVVMFLPRLVVHHFHDKDGAHQDIRRAGLTPGPSGAPPRSAAA